MNQEEPWEYSKELLSDIETYIDEAEAWCDIVEGTDAGEQEDFPGGLEALYDIVSKIKADIEADNSDNFMEYGFKATAIRDSMARSISAHFG